MTGQQSRVGITALGAYVPRLRLQRSAIVAAHGWSDPGLAAKGRGERSMCNWDEDSVTMAVEAGRRLLSDVDSLTPDAVYFASTSAPFVDRQNAGIISAALNLGEAGITTLDLGASQRSGVSALIQAFGAVGGGLHDQVMVVASDHRASRASSAGELAYGDGAAAFAVGRADGAADVMLEYLASASSSVDFVDHFRGAGADFDYTWEERWIRDEGLAKIVPPCIASALERAGLSAADIQHFAMPSTIGRAVAGIAKRAGIDADTVVDNLHDCLGETGVAHPLLMALHALESRGARPGDHLMMIGFGQGCEAVILKVTDGFTTHRTEFGLTGALAARQAEDNYQKYLAFNNLIQLEKGMRAENSDYKTALSVTYRKRDMLTGLVGGKCSQCGTAQFPRTDICVNPQCGAEHTQQPHPFREAAASILTWSADYLTYSAAPPAHYGMITFADGGRFMTDFTDVNVGEIDVGMDVRMVFRIKSMDNVRGFVRYFWKAVPVRNTEQQAAAAG